MAVSPDSTLPLAKRKSNVHPSSHRNYLVTPVSNDEESSAQATITGLLNAGWYVFAEKTPGLKQLKPGDQICFYSSGTGIVAEAEVASMPKLEPPPVKGIAKNLEKFQWSFQLSNARLFFKNPIVIDADLRLKLEKFEGKDPTAPWSWFVQGTRIVSEHDFLILTGKEV